LESLAETQTAQAILTRNGENMFRAVRPPMARIMLIDQELRARSWPNASTLSRRLEVNERTIRRDIAYLRDQLLAPIEFDREHNGYYYTEPTYRLPYLQLSYGELVALGLAEGMVRSFRGTPFESDLKHAIAKLKAGLPADAASRLEAISDYVSVLPAVQSSYDSATFSALSAAVADRRRVEMVYWTASRNQTTRRTVDPYELILLDGVWYIVAYCHHRRSIRIFAMLRVKSVTPTGETFDRPSGFDVERYMNGSFRAVRGDGNYQVVLRFTAGSAGRVAERAWHQSQVSESLPDGGLIVRFLVNDLREIKRWVLAWGTECEVLEPRELRELIVRDISAILQRQGVSTHV
jgi:predicted DNA-binding transcriptional regulator YafY